MDTQVYAIYKHIQVSKWWRIMNAAIFLTAMSNVSGLKKNFNKGKLYFCLQLKKICPLGIGRNGRNVGWMVTPPYWQWENRERWMLVLSLISSFYLLEFPAYRMMPPTFWVGRSSSAKHSHKHTLRCISIVILNPIKLTMNINHYMYALQLWEW